MKSPDQADRPRRQLGGDHEIDIQRAAGIAVIIDRKSTDKETREVRLSSVSVTGKYISDRLHFSILRQTAVSVNAL